jgi:hypothetical protein
MDIRVPKLPSGIEQIRARAGIERFMQENQQCVEFEDFYELIRIKTISHLIVIAHVNDERILGDSDEKSTFTA